METVEVKVVVNDTLKKLQDSIKRQINYIKEVADDRIALKAILADQADGTEIDLDAGYHTYNEWIEQLNKEIKTGVASLEREKAEIVAYEFYLENVDKAEPAE